MSGELMSGGANVWGANVRGTNVLGTNVLGGANVWGSLCPITHHNGNIFGTWMSLILVILKVYILVLFETGVIHFTIWSRSAGLRLHTSCWCQRGERSWFAGKSWGCSQFNLLHCTALWCAACCALFALFALQHVVHCAGLLPDPHVCIPITVWTTESPIKLDLISQINFMVVP